VPDVVVNPQGATTGGFSNIALPWYDSGFSVVPILPNGTKRPAREWFGLQKQRMSRREVEYTWGPGRDAGVAVICGAISGDAEMTELEVAASSEHHLTLIEKECEKRGIKALWESLLNDGYSEFTPSGGLHLIYRIADHHVPGNTKIASAADGKTLAETRGEGGYVIVAPTDGKCHPSGESWTTTSSISDIQTITWEQRMTIHSAIHAALDESPPLPEPMPRAEVRVRVDGERLPGDDFEALHDWEEPWFTSKGWTITHRAGHETFWSRPGKDPRDGHSASTGYAGDRDRLYVFSTSAGLPTEQPLTKFFVYAQLYYGGSTSLAAQALAAGNALGVIQTRPYGSRATAPAPPRLQALGDLEPAASVAELERLLSDHTDTRLDLTDTGNGQRLRQRHGHRFRYNNTEAAWYMWTGQAWEMDQRQEIQRAATETARWAEHLARENLKTVLAEHDNDEKNEEVKIAKRLLGEAKSGLNNNRLNAAIARFSSELGISVTSDDFDTDMTLLNTKNGTLNLETMQLTPHDPADMLTLSMDAKVDPEATCPRFDRFMEDVLPNPQVRSYVQRAMGYTLLGKPAERSMFMLHGPSGTGKSVFTNVMSHIFGGYGTTAPASTFRMKKSDTTADLHSLRGKRFVATSEMPEGAQLDEELMKRLTGGDLVSSRNLYQTFHTWKPRCVIWIATNFLPKVNSDDNAIWRRAKTIPMLTEFGNHGLLEIPGYAEILMSERDGILNWLLAGLAAYRARGLDEPEAITQDVESYRESSDTVMCWINESLEEGILVQGGTSARTTLLYQMYRDYCHLGSYGALGQRRWSNRLLGLGYLIVKDGSHNAVSGIGPNPMVTTTGVLFR
jgi:putative DNA primase/helicase